MLTVLSANENLLERLELLIQNSPRPFVDEGNNGNGGAKVAEDEQKEEHQQWPQMLRAYPVLLPVDTQGLPLQLPSGTPRRRAKEENNGGDDEENAADEAEQEGMVPGRNGRPPFCTRWMLLMARKGFNEHKTTLHTLGDLCRLSLAMTRISVFF